MRSVPEPTSLRRLTPMVLALAAACGASLAGAQSAPGGRPYSLEPSVSLSGTFTDNQGLTSDHPRPEAVAQAVFGLRASSQAGRLRGFADYALTAVGNLRNTAPDDVRQTLNAFGTLEAIEGRGFVDMAAAITQEPRSAFAVLPSDPALGGTGRTEVTTLRITPRFTGRFGDTGVLGAQWTQSETRSHPEAASDLRSSNALVSARTGTTGIGLTLGGQVSGNVYDFSNGRHLTETVLRANAAWAVDMDLTLGVLAGRESNNFRSAQRESNTLYGVTALWQPGPRTSLDAELSHRHFGTGYNIAFAHRFARTAFSFTDVREVSPPENGIAQGRRGTLFELLDLQYASTHKDPAERRDYVLGLLDAANLDPAQAAVMNFLTSSVTLNHRQQFAFSWIGLRDTLTVTLGREDRRRFDTVLTPLPGDDFSSTTVVRQRAMTASLAHRLTPLSQLVLSASVQRVTGDLAAQHTTQHALNLQWNGRIGARSDLTVGVGHVEGDSVNQPYQASTVTSTLRMQF